MMMMMITPLCGCVHAFAPYAFELTPAMVTEASKTCGVLFGLTKGGQGKKSAWRAVRQTNARSRGCKRC